MQINKKYLQMFVASLLILWVGLFIVQQLDLVTADLGRFIQNGKQVFDGHWQDILQSNFYSYTFSQYPFLNHHWGTGVIFYFFHQLGGFVFLHLFALSLILVTFLLFFRKAKKEGGFVVATLLSLMLIPLMTYRKEVRPEIFSCFFSGIFFYILWGWRSKEISAKWLWLLPTLEVFWVNLHIYFFLGVAIIGAFFLEEVISFWKRKKESLKLIGVVGGATVLATFINPFGWKGVLHPLNVYNNYGYQVLEEQSVWFLENLGIHNPTFVLFQGVLLLVGLSFFGVILKRRKDFPWVNFFLASGFTFMACWSIRNISLFAFISLPILAKNIKIIWPTLNFNSFNKKIFASVIALGIVFVLLISYRNFLPANTRTFGLGLPLTQSQAIDFFKGNNLQGPIFNNYDIGGYLIYYLFPQEKVFVDNRPEAYPQDFFEDIYIPMQADEEIWREKSLFYGINTIIFYWHDATPWGQQFLSMRIQDSTWAPVFVDEQILVFLKRNELNKKIIDKFELPQDIFSFQKN